MAKRKKQNYGSGSIYTTANGRFMVAVRLKENEKPVRRRASNRQEAERIRAELLALRDSGVRVDYALEPFGVYADWWFNDVYMQSAPSARSCQHTIDMIQWYVLPAIGKDVLSAIQHDALQRLLNGLRHAKRGTPLSAQTKNHVARILKQMFKKAYTANYITRDPSEDLVVPKIDRAPKEAPTVDEVRRLLEIVGTHPHALAYQIMATLGTRLGETLALRRIDFNGDFSEVKIDSAVSYHTLEIGTPKRNSKRPLPVPPLLALACRAQWEKAKTNEGWNPLGYILPSEAGTIIQPSNFEKAWNGYVQRRETKKQGVKEYVHKGFKHKAGLPDAITIHSLRSFVATMLVDADTAQSTIGHILGHGAKNVTERYIRRFMPTMRRALEALERTLWEEGMGEKTGT